MQYIRNTHHHGYTLIELLLYISIVGALLLGLTMFFAMSTTARIKNQTISEVTQQGTAALELITQTARNADSITVPAVGASSTSLSLAVPTASLSPSVFNLSGTSLQIKEGSTAAVPLTNDKVQVTALTVKNLSRANTPGLVQVSLTINRTNSSGRNEYSFQRTFTTSVSIRP